MVPMMPVLARFVLPVILTAAAAMTVAMIAMVNESDEDRQKRFDRERDEQAKKNTKK